MAWITSYYDGSFNSVGFWQQDQSSIRTPRPGKRASVQWIHYPGSDDNERIDGGLLQREFSLKVAATKSDAAALDALVNTTHTLVYSGGTVTATLDSTQDWTEGPTSADDWAFITLNFSY